MADVAGGCGDAPEEWGSASAHAMSSARRRGRRRPRRVDTAPSDSSCVLYALHANDAGVGIRWIGVAALLPSVR